MRVKGVKGAKAFANGTLHRLATEKTHSSHSISLIYWNGQLGWTPAVGLYL